MYRFFVLRRVRVATSGELAREVVCAQYNLASQRNLRGNNATFSEGQPTAILPLWRIRVPNLISWAGSHPAGRSWCGGLPLLSCWVLAGFPSKPMRRHQMACNTRWPANTIWPMQCHKMASNTKMACNTNWPTRCHQRARSARVAYNAPGPAIPYSLQHTMAYSAHWPAAPYCFQST